MKQKILVPLAVFLVVLVALTFGETIGHELLLWIEDLTGLVLHNFADVFRAVQQYIDQNTSKILIALVVTVPISIWLLRNHGQALAKRTSQRKIAIVLAVFLGWLGAHRFYLGQIGWGIVYLIIFWVFTPLVVIIGLIDAIRYFFMTEEEFAPLRQ
ncbi:MULTISPECIES: TM2 domain-containing protein [unclassified Pusillimonas]|uniref:TM2 domain-containing protein n=1 Tax=unclassified Pusillimonas TaxID=2640016 RepID=UPI000B8E5454|nr:MULTISPECIES: TM2 domain-containing protein [unclassified Pusillimonas]OXR49722.1 hypothetical protein PuT2_08070 [Pusillimonas sp. T2]ROT45124.1 TM2 domain-containing protein [Pusillimonas sp. NJUB218]